MTGARIQRMGAVAPLLVIIALLASPAGIGGGILFTPVLHLVGELDSKEASATSQALIAASQLASCIINFWTQWHEPKKPLIILPYVIIMLPCIVAGAVIGVYLNMILPQLIILILYVLVAAFSTIKTTLKGVKQYRSENATKKASKEHESPSSASQKTIVTLEEAKEKKVDPFLVMPSRKVLFFYWTTAFLIWVLCLIFPLLRGSSTAKSIAPVPYCGGVYWFLAALEIALLLGISSGFIFAKRKVCRLVQCCILGVEIVFTGIISSMVGIGGGILMNPIILDFGLNPQQGTATNAINIFAMSTSTALSYGMSGYFPGGSDMWIVVLPFVGGIIGKLVLKQIVAKTGRMSVLVFLLAGITCAGCIIVLVTGIISNVRDASKGINIMQIGHVCS
ncbi:conserved hypothetical protein [Perkinsus marinus ATCC 50983]|uniref:Uncharacterized protein n=1 Tax=Perkinsus marinus (strain ATCC 50983 / TXsc) TaxID=423536 RepID=C5KHA8_PERM5|nr:conserved hypothetical protein [Perkinsus marinus ATCC 50983]EER15970.1 conserved hypothetical protein [Perkinsus marinus ATCC 50983]|eukprot:XP_002784174.1 conserved hypothetical protein [Perkinsus marinus ATCC 50983]